MSGAVSYVTGSHNAKAGVKYRYANSDRSAPGANAHLTQQYQNRLPISVLVYALPHNVNISIDEFAAYGMDSWVLQAPDDEPGRAPGPVQRPGEPDLLPAGRFVGPRRFPSCSRSNPFFDVSPRLSAVYDLFGNARTALKFSANKYLTQLNIVIHQSVCAQQRHARHAVWLDTDFIPGTATPSGQALPTNGDNIAQDNEIGPRQNNRFGLAPEQRADPDLNREYSWDYSASVQHEIVPQPLVHGGLVLLAHLRCAADDQCAAPDQRLHAVSGRRTRTTRPR